MSGNLVLAAFSMADMEKVLGQAEFRRGKDKKKRRRRNLAIAGGAVAGVGLLGAGAYALSRKAKGGKGGGKLMRTSEPPPLPGGGRGGAITRAQSSSLDRVSSVGGAIERRPSSAPRGSVSRSSSGGAQQTSGSQSGDAIRINARPVKGTRLKGDTMYDSRIDGVETRRTRMLPSMPFTKGPDRLSRYPARMRRAIERLDGKGRRKGKK